MRNRQHPLSGQHAVITGGGSGLGFAMASSMRDAGANVTLIGRREDTLRQAQEMLGAGVQIIVADISNLESAPGIVKQAELIGPVDILVNNAGRHHKAETLSTTDDDFSLVIATNLFGTFAITREFARGMVQRCRGNILMITSMAALFGLPAVAAYTASKSALQGLVRQLAVEFAPYQVRVNAIAPGFIETDMNRDIFERDPIRLEKILSRTPLGVLGSPEDIGEAAVYLASPAARFVTGVCLPVDGGILIGF